MKVDVSLKRNKMINSTLGKNYRYIILMTAAFSFFITMFHRVSSGTIRADLTEQFGINASAFANFSAMYFYAYMCMQIPVGILADNWSPKKTVSLGLLLTTAGTLIFAIAPSYPVACLGRALVGIGVSAPVVCNYKLLPAWFEETRIASAQGCCSVISNLGNIFAQAPLALLIGCMGLRTSFVAIGIITGIFAVIYYQLVWDKPTEIGLPQVNENLFKFENNSKRKKMSIGQVLIKTFTNKYNLPVIIMCFCHLGSYNLFGGVWGVSYIREVYGYSNIEASSIITYVMIGSTISSFILPRLSDRYLTRKKPEIFISAFTFIMWMIITFMTDVIRGKGMLIACMFLLGFSNSGIPLLLNLIREYNDPRATGTMTGIVNTIGMGSGAILPVITGKILDLSLGLGFAGAELYRRTFMVPVILTFIAFICSFMIKETNCRSIFGRE